MITPYVVASATLASMIACVLASEEVAAHALAVLVFAGAFWLVTTAALIVAAAG